VAIVILLILFVVIAFAIVSAVCWRDYRRAYAEIHHDAPPFGVWWLKGDPHSDVEAARRLAILSICGSVVAFAVFAIVIYLFPL
jgi:hypothetical protein